MCCLVGNIIEYAEYLTVLFLQILYHLVQFLVFVSELEEVSREFHVLKFVGEKLDELLDVLVELLANLHQTFADFRFPILNDGCILYIGSDSFSSKIPDSLKVLHLMLVALINIEQLSRRHQTLEAEVAFLLLGVKHSWLLMLLTKHFNRLTTFLIL